MRQAVQERLDSSYLSDGTTLGSWLFTRDHKRIALLYLLSITTFFLVGGTAAILMRLELLSPTPYLVTSETYNRLFTLHGVIMVWFFLIPAIPNVFMTTEETLPAAPQEQFVSAQQQRVAVTLGMWIFLATEVLFFGGLLVIYSAYRTWYPHDFATGSRHLDILQGTFNTAVLLTSSFLMAGAVTASRLQDRRTAFLLLLLTAGCGTTFVAIKGYEWHTAISDGFWPVSLAQPRGVDLFYSLYFVMTGLHGLHLLIGISLILATAFRSRRDASFAPNQNHITLLELYWHFVDVVWIFLFPLLYFIGRSS